VNTGEVSNPRPDFFLAVAALACLRSSALERVLGHQ
jgi:hypothetical protein